MFIVLDTNIWLSEFGLNTALGATLRFFIKYKKATLVLPEVIKEEVERNLNNQLVQKSKEIEKNYRQLLQVFGKLKELVLPNEEEIKTVVDNLFSNLKIETLFIPFTLESAKSSLQKINDKVPPSRDKDQQFKDGVIWHNCLNLLNNRDVFLITNDRAFYQDRDYSKGLAKNLINEAESYPHKLIISSEIKNLLEEIKVEIDLNTDELVSQYMIINVKNIDSLLERTNFVISSEGKSNYELFATEDPDKLFLDFNIEFKCSDSTDNQRFDASLTLKGNGYYLPNSKQFTDLKSSGEELKFYESDGELKTNSNVYLRADGIVFGHRNIQHKIINKL